MSMLKVGTQTRRVGKRKAEIPDQVLPQEAAVARGDWRNQLLLGSRQRIVNKMMQTLERHLPFSGQERPVEIMKMASRFEEKVYAAATSQVDYLRKISLKMLAMETTSKKKPMANSFQSNGASSSQIKPGPVHVQVEIPNQIMSGKAVMATDLEVGDWRMQLQPDSRERVVNKVIEILKGQSPSSRPEGQQEHRKIAVRFEETIFAAATSKSDYLRKISSKMLLIDFKSPKPMATNSFQSNAASSSQIIPDPVIPAAGPHTFMVDSDNWQAHRRVEIPDQVVSGKAVMATDMEWDDWRTLLQPDYREGIVNKIMEILKGRAPFCRPERLQEIGKIAVRFEEKIFAAATSKSDYLKKISLKILTNGIERQSPMRNSFQSNAASGKQNS